ncbi:related to Phosducin [Sporisorium reilianum f. sp. reilianum]|uniref:Related to Phosducin n=1 Tax=Sporisorium reilianum f. sp. reilianum TaxID=72559 RepID=A0A2N8UBU6_9BASI|nr:related to Phosducin [Sporisorium reilianum f. sp. reilianum]
MSASGDAIEAAILHGVDAQPASAYREDRRAAAAAAHDSDHSAPNTDDELGSDLPDDDVDYYNDEDDDAPHSRSAAAGASSDGGIKGLMSSRTANRGEEGATNTGPKGVLRDRQLQAQQESAARTASVHATNRQMQAMALSSETYAEQVAREKREQAARLQRENRDSDDDDDDDAVVSQSAIADLQAKERRREMRIAELKSFHAARNTALVSGDPASTSSNPATTTADRYFGHLREVDERGYVSSIDNEHPHVTIVIHIYSKAVAQCNALTASLASLARVYPHTKFLQVQAAAIGFGRSDDDDDEEEFDDYSSKTLQVLPTVLVYRAGRLVANLVRLDLDPLWRQGTEQDVRDLLVSHGALPADDAGQATGLANRVLSDDEEDD